MRSKNKKTVALCSSAAFFKQALEIEKQLRSFGFAVKLPYTAMKMKQAGDFRPETYKTWFKDATTYHRKGWLIKNHFRKIIDSDAILVINHEKNGVPGYIGGNTLIEMGIAFHHKKPIYILDPISDSANFKEEILGMHPVFLNGNIKKISL